MSSQLAPPLQDSIELIPPTSTSTSTDRPDSHTQKYDRQLRLWASSGQQALENANVLVVGSNATATSTLKNLVLPGIGQFTILCPEIVKEEDLGVNFFLDPSSLGKSRAQESVKFLNELNEDVKGVAIVKSLSEFLSTPTSISPYSLILSFDLPFQDLVALSEESWNRGIPFVRVETNGFYARLTSQVEELCIIETHPESLIDLRIHHPFPSLVEYCCEGDQFDYEKMDSKQHGHVPAVVILVKALKKWKDEHDGNNPTGTEERKEFVATVLKEKRTSDEENFDEAVGLFRRVGTKVGIPSEIEALFNDDSCRNIDKNSSNFWILVQALQRFVHSSPSTNPHHLLPLTGSLPDMKSDSTGYVTLQNLYRSKSRQDLETFREILEKVYEEKGIERRSGSEEVESFVKHSGWLKVVRGRKLRSSLENPQQSLLNGKIGELLEQSGWNSPPDQSLSIYLSLETCLLFQKQHNRYPGSDEDDLSGEKDHEEMLRLVRELLKGLGYEGDGEVPESVENCIKEVCRSAQSTLPQTSALVGGLVAQESIKIVTKQYVPLVGTCVWDGITSATGRVEA